MRRLQLLLLLLGVGLFVYILHKVSLDRVARGLYSVGWSFVTIFALELVIDFLHSEGWRWCLPHHGHAVTRLDTFLARLAGVAVNVLTPTATVGGEVVKGVLLRRWVPFPDGFASVMVDKLTFALGQTVFLFCGAFAVLTGLSFDAEERALALSALGLWVVAVIAFFALQRAGIFRVSVGVARTIFGSSTLIESLPGHAEFDTKVSAFLAVHRVELGISVLLHVLAQLTRVPQYYFAMSALNLHPTAAACFTTAAGLVFMEATMFLIPAKLGVFEGGNALIFSRLGYGVAAGIVVSFALRISELASALLGLGALAYFHFRPSEVAALGLEETVKDSEPISPG
jgi:hypothetical protein